MPESSKSQTLFDLCAGHPALDFVNSLDNRFRQDGPVELLTSYGNLLRFMAETRLLSTQQARLLKATNQDAHAAVVQHEGLRKPHESATVSCAPGSVVPPGGAAPPDRASRRPTAVLRISR